MEVVNQYLGEATEIKNKLNELAKRVSTVIDRELTEDEVKELKGFGDYLLVRNLEKAGVKFTRGKYYIAVDAVPEGFEHTVDEIQDLLNELKEVGKKVNFTTIVKNGQFEICPNELVRLNAKF